MDKTVVVAAQQYEVIKGGFTSIHPVIDVVSIDPPIMATAGNEDAWKRHPIVLITCYLLMK